jgi:hypothetical protein
LQPLGLGISHRDKRAPRPATNNRQLRQPMDDGRNDFMLVGIDQLVDESLQASVSVAACFGEPVIRGKHHIKAAVNAAGQSGHVRLVLIDGDELTKLLVRFNVGVRVARTIEMKRIDLDYFEDGDPE